MSLGPGELHSLRTSAKVKTPSGVKSGEDETDNRKSDTSADPSGGRSGKAVGGGGPESLNISSISGRRIGLPDLIELRVGSGEPLGPTASLSVDTSVVERLVVGELDQGQVGTLRDKQTSGTVKWDGAGRALTVKA